MNYSRPSRRTDGVVKELVACTNALKREITVSITFNFDFKRWESENLIIWRKAQLAKWGRSQRDIVDQYKRYLSGKGKKVL